MHPTAELSRRALVSRGVRAGATIALSVAAAGAVAGAAVGAPAASGLLADQDLATARLAVAAELLAIEFYGRAVGSGQFTGNGLKALERALFNEQEHLAAVTGILTGAGQSAPTAGDFAFTLPADSFASRTSIAKLGVTLETAFVGAYVGAAAAFVPVDLRGAAASIAASEAEHLSFLSSIATGRPVGVSFPAPLDLAAASDALAAYLG